VTGSCTSQPVRSSYFHEKTDPDRFSSVRSCFLCEHDCPHRDSQSLCTCFRGRARLRCQHVARGRLFAVASTRWGVLRKTAIGFTRRKTRKHRSRSSTFNSACRFARTDHIHDTQGATRRHCHSAERCNKSHDGCAVHRLWRSRTPILPNLTGIGSEISLQSPFSAPRITGVGRRSASS